LGDLPEDSRVSLNLKNRISEMYGGTHFAVRMWPQHGFKNTLWWCEKDVAPYNAGYFLKVDSWRGPALYVGITVEKGVEDPEEATRRAQAKGTTAQELLMDETWDWCRALSSLPAMPRLFMQPYGR
jgi:hypothetical protein